MPEMQQGTDMAYGCLFCLTGKEQMVADNIQRACPEVEALVARVEKYRTIKGKKLRVTETLLPGYVFFRAPARMNPVTTFPRDALIRILFEEESAWRLTEKNAEFAQWLFRYHGFLGFSQAYKLDEWVHIVSGPLKDMEGRITKMDKRGLSGQISLEIGGKTISAWLSFELIEKGKIHARTSSDPAPTPVQGAAGADPAPGFGGAGGPLLPGPAPGRHAEKA